jgi:hypothetical protein
MIKRCSANLSPAGAASPAQGTTVPPITHHPASKSIQFCAMRLSVCSLLLMCTLMAPRVDVLRQSPRRGVKSSRYLKHSTAQHSTRQNTQEVLAQKQNAMRGTQIDERNTDRK